MHWTRTNVAAALLPTLLALALRLYDLAGKPLWLDEITTQKRALLPLQELVTNSFNNRHFPAYFVLVRAFDPPLIDEWTLRLPSVLFGCAAVLLVGLIAADVRSPRAGLVAGLLMALSPIEVQFAQEARPYALASALMLLALWGLVRITSKSTVTRAGWTAYIVGTVAALNVLIVSAFWLIASNLAMLAITRGAAPQRAQLRRHWLFAQAVILLAWLPGLISFAFATDGDPLRGYRWIPPSTLEHVWAVLSAVYLFRVSDITTFQLLPALVPGFGIAISALAVFGAWRLNDRPKLLAVIGVAFVTMPIVMLIVSIFQPFWIPRYLLWSTGPLFVLAGVGTAALPPRIFPFATAAIVIAGLINLAPYYSAETKPRWDLAAEYLAKNARAGDIIIANNTAARYVLSAYAARYRLNDPIVDGTNPSQVAERLPPNARMWIVFGRVGQIMPVSEDRYLERWSGLGVPAATIRFGRHVVAMRFDRVPAQTNR